MAKTRARPSQKWCVGQPPEQQRRHLRADQPAERKSSGNDRWLQGAIPDLIINALYLEHLEERAYARFGGATTLGDVKALAPGHAYSEPPPTAFDAYVQKRAGKVHEDHQKTAKNFDANIDTHRTQLGPSGQR